MCVSSDGGSIQEARDYPGVILSSQAAQKHPATLLQRFCCPDKPLLGGNTVRSDAGGAAQQSMGSGGSRGSPQEGVLSSQSGEKLGPRIASCIAEEPPHSWSLGLAVFPRPGFLFRLGLQMGSK